MKLLFPRGKLQLKRRLKVRFRELSTSWVDWKAYYRILIQILILIPKLYSISMNHTETASYQATRPQQGHQSHLSTSSSKRKNQIQNADLRSHTASISENIQNNGEKGEEEVVSACSGDGKGREVFRKGRGCAAGTAIQFSILIGLILIQYISAAVTLLPLFAVLLLALLLHPPLAVLVLQIPPMIQQRISSAGPDRKAVVTGREGANEDNPIPTIPKINQQACKRANAKTKKLQFPNMGHQEQKNTELTIKKQTDSPQEEGRSQEQPPHYEEAFAFKKSLLAVFKVLQVILQVTVTSLSLFSFTDENSPYRKVVVGLCILAYILAVASSLMFALFFTEINSYQFPADPLSQRQEQKQQQPRCFEQPQPKTKVSIDQLIQAKPIERKKTFSIDIKVRQTFRSEEGEQSQKMEQKQETKSQVEKDAAINLQIKRSVLKPSKVYQTKSRKTSQKSVAQEMMQRRRVQINSKKIQYFEYCQISPSQSIGEDQEASGVKAGIKSKFNSQRMKYMRQRMQAESRILSSKLMARQAEVDARSQGCLSNPARSPPVQQEETRVDHFL